MIYLYAIIKILTFPGSVIRAAMEQSACRKHKIPVEDENPFRFDELCGHVEHELPDNRKAAASIVIRPFLFNLIVGFFVLTAASVSVYAVGDYCAVDVFLFWLGISLWTNVFPSLESGSNYLFLAKNDSSGIAKFIAKFMQIGSVLDSWSLTLPLALLCSYALPFLFGLCFQFLSGTGNF